MNLIQIEKRTFWLGVMGFTLSVFVTSITCAIALTSEIATSKADVMDQINQSQKDSAAAISTVKQEFGERITRVETQMQDNHDEFNTKFDDLNGQLARIYKVDNYPVKTEKGNNP